MILIYRQQDQSLKSRVCRLLRQDSEWPFAGKENVIQEEEEADEEEEIYLPKKKKARLDDDDTSSTGDLKDWTVFVDRRQESTNHDLGKVFFGRLLLWSCSWSRYLVLAINHIISLVLTTVKASLP